MESKSSGVTLKRESFESATRGLRNPKKQLFYLHENGKDLESLKERGLDQVDFVLGDHVGLDPASERFLDSLRIQRVSIGPRSYLSSSCIVFVNSFLDSIEG